MIYKIVTVLSIMLISTYGNESKQKPKIAISSQSFYRDDVPLSYKFAAVHNHKHNKRNKNVGQLRYPSIQYAPLPEAKLKEHTVFQNEGNQNEYRPESAQVHLIKVGHHVYSTERTRNKDHLEPRLEEETIDEHKHSHRSNILGYNVELIPQPSSGYLGPFDAHITHQEKSQAKQTKSPNVSYYKKPKKDSVDSVTPVLIEGETTTPSDIPAFRGLQPEDYVALLPVESRSQHNAYSLHNNLALEKRQQSYQHVPRIHLNIARIYNIANSPKKEVPLPPANIGNPQVKSRGLWREYYRPKGELPKTILHPVISSS